MSVTVDSEEKSGDIVVVPKKSPVALDCHPGGRLYRGDEEHTSRFILTEATQGSYHCRCPGGRRSNGRNIVGE